MASEYHAGSKAARTAVSDPEGTVLALFSYLQDKTVLVSLDAGFLAATRDEIAVESQLLVVRLGGHG
jgi:hypothetical protein